MPLRHTIACAQSAGYGLGQRLTPPPVASTTAASFESRVAVFLGRANSLTTAITVKPKI